MQVAIVGVALQLSMCEKPLQSGGSEVLGVAGALPECQLHE